MRGRTAHIFESTALFLLLLLLGVFLKNGEVAAKGVSEGWELCIKTLLPALFPFLVLSELLLSMGAEKWLGKPFFRPVRALFGLTRSGTAALIIGMPCGFPTGMAVAMRLYQKGEITRDEVRRLLLFANNPSIGFLVGFVGGKVLGDVRLGVALFLITWLSSLLVGMFLRISCGDLPDIPRNGASNRQSSADLGGCIARAFFTLLRVFAPILFFSCVAACFFSFLPLAPSGVGGVLLQGALELTGGIARAGALDARMAFLISAFLSSFAGLSVCLQLFSVCEGVGARLLPYLLAKALQGTVAFLLAMGYWNFFHPVFGHFAQNGICFFDFLPFLLLLASGASATVLLMRKRKRKAKAFPFQQFSRNERSV